MVKQVRDILFGDTSWWFTVRIHWHLKALEQSCNRQTSIIWLNTIFSKPIEHRILSEGHLLTCLGTIFWRIVSHDTYVVTTRV